MILQVYILLYYVAIVLKGLKILVLFQFIWTYYLIIPDYHLQALFLFTLIWIISILINKIPFFKHLHGVWYVLFLTLKWNRSEFWQFHTISYIFWFFGYLLVRFMMVMLVMGNNGGRRFFLLSSLLYSRIVYLLCVHVGICIEEILVLVLCIYLYSFTCLLYSIYL